MAEFDPAPKLLEEVLRPEWLTAMLRQRWPDVTVRAVTVTETLITVATKVRLHLDLDGAAADAPRDICIKGMLTDTGGGTSASIVETLFYQNLADTLGVNVPPHVHAALNAAGDNGVLVMRDMIAAGGRFCSALVPFTLEEAFDGLEQLARLHASSLDGSANYAVPWIPRFLDRITERPIMPLDVLQGMLDGPRGEPLPAEIRSAERLQRGLTALAERVRGVPNCLIHGDVHAGNVYRAADGALGVVDWQVLQKGDWAQDVGYHLAAVLTPEDRRAHERGLLRRYLARLHELGGPAVPEDEAWARYRAGMVYGYYLWAITRKVDPPITMEFNRRLGLAVADLDSFGLVGV